MKSVRNIIDSNKGFFTLCLLLCFVSASNARNVASLFHDVHTVKFCVGKPAKYFISTATNESDLSTISLKDSDVDDVEFTYYGNYISHNVVLPAEKHNFIPETEHFSAYKIPLYDLYCNWKFHLS